MKVANLHAIGDLRIEERPVPACEKDEVLVRVHACGICGSDLPRVYTKGTYHFPTVIGHEFAGVVEHDPQGELTGKPVAVFPLLPCFHCESCQAQQYATCSDYDYYGSRRDGGLSEYLAVKRFNILEMPAGLPYEQGAMCEPISVARHAAKKLVPFTGSLLITGAGPIGLIAGQWAKAFGAKQVYYTDIDPYKLELARSFGFAPYEKGLIVDAAIEGTGHPAALQTMLEAVRPGGKAVFMGNPGGDMPMSQSTYWQILRKELTVYGTWNSSYAEQENDWKESLTALADGRINVAPLITHRYPLTRVNQALEMMKNRQESYGKVMITL